MSYKTRHKHRDRHVWRAKSSASELLRPVMFRKTSEPSIGSPQATIDLIRAADVPSKPVSYFWPPAIAFGKVSVILAPTATCTSALIAEFVAKASVGGELPQTQGPVPTSDTAIVAAEVAVAERIRPQLDAAGTDLSRVYFVASNGGKTVGVNRFDPIADCKLLIAAIRACGNVKLVIVEFAIRRIDADIARNYKPIIASFYTIAHELDLAIVISLYPSEDLPGRKQLAQAAKAVASLHAVGGVGVATREPNSGRWVLAWSKTIVGHDAPGLAFRIEAKVTSSGDPAAVIVWDPEPVTAIEIIKFLAVGGKSNARPSKLQHAKDFLADHVKAGLVEAAELDALAAKAGISKVILTKARKALGIKVGKKDALIKLSAVKHAKEFLLAELASGPVLAKVVRQSARKEEISKASLRRAGKALKIVSNRKGGIASRGHWVWRLPTSAKEST